MKPKTTREVIAVLNARIATIFYSPIPDQQLTKPEQHEVNCLRRAIAIVRASREMPKCKRSGCPYRSVARGYCDLHGASRKGKGPRG